MPVKKAVSQQCLPGEASNSPPSRGKAPRARTNTPRSARPGRWASPSLADSSLCDEPGITKATTTTTTTDPAAVTWTVTVTNPATGSQGPGTTQTVYIKDSGVEVVSGPSYTGSASCTTSDFEADLNGSGVQCSMPDESTITFEVKPAGTLARTCNDQKFNNTAYLYIGNTTGTPLSDAGEEITLQGDPELCTRNLEVCKLSWATATGSSNPARSTSMSAKRARGR